MKKKAEKRGTRRRVAPMVRPQAIERAFENAKSAIVKGLETFDKRLAPKAQAAFEFRSTLNAETDRGCALMAAAYLDDQLGELLRAYLVDDSKTADELFGPLAPLGTFSSRIDLAYMLGLVGPHARRELHLIRKIRNEFGHKYKPMTFEDPGIKSRCSGFKAYSLLPAGTARGNFTRTVMGILAVLHVRVGSANHRPQRSEGEIELSSEARKIFDLLIGSGRARNSNDKTKGRLKST